MANALKFGQEQPLEGLEPVLTLTRQEAPTPNYGQVQMSKLGPKVEDTSTPKPETSVIKPEEAYKLWKANPDPSNGAELLKALQPQIENAARQHAKSTSPVVIGQARSLIIDALPRYDGRSSLNTFVHHQLRPLQRWSAKHRSPAKLPTSYASEYRMLTETMKNLEADLGREPSRAELADASGMRMERIAKIFATPMAVVSERETPGGGGEDNYSEAGDQGVEQDNQLWMKTVYHSLNPTNQFILEHTTGLYGSKVYSNQEIAKKLRISPSAVSQRRAQIQQMMDE